ncbi:MAG: GtrA family protein [Nanoarchaeota archaeon]
MNTILRKFRYHLGFFLRFCIVGAVATVINYALFYVLLAWFSLFYMLASAAGYIVGGQCSCRRSIVLTSRFLRLLSTNALRFFSL